METKKIGNDNNWIAEIAAKFLQAGNSPNELSKNKLSIVSFNYDTIFIDAFRNFIFQDEIFADLQEDILPSVHHVFGKFPSLTPNITNKDISQYAARMNFMEEIRTGKPKEISVIENKILRAEKIFLIGFDCHNINIDLIKLNKTQADIYALNYDGNDRLDLQLSEKLELPENHIMKGSAEDPLGISKAVSNGFLDLSDRFSKQAGYSLVNL